MVKEGNIRFSIIMTKELKDKLNKSAQANGFKKTNDYINFILFQHVKNLEENKNN